MTRFTLRAKLATPVIRRGCLTLDALLMSILGRGDVSDLLLCEQDLYFASAGFMAVGDTGQPANFVASMRPELSPHLFDLVTHNTHNKELEASSELTGARHRYNDVRIGLARQRECGNVTSSYSALSRAEIEWYAIGDAQAVLHAVRHVPAIGKRRAAGYGEVLAWEVEDGALDGVRGFFGEPLRPVPVARWIYGGHWIPVEAAWKAPYWDVRNRTQCFVAELE